MEISLKSFVFLIFVGVVLGENGCPPASYIKPCTCTDVNTGFAEMTCNNIENTDIILNIFKKTQRYNYVEVKFVSSSMQFMPVEVFSLVNIFRLYFLNVTLISLFDAPPQGNDLQQFLIVNSTIQGGVRWDMFQNFKRLNKLEMDNYLVENIGTTFAKYVPRALKTLILKHSRTKQIKAGVFKDYPLLEAVEVSGGLLKSLRRDIFPTPSRIITLYFNDNQLTSIPDDLFTQMPELSIVYLHNNKLTTLPESAFAGRSANLWMLSLQGNSIACDCRLLWLIKRKPEALYGNCSEPPNMKGKELQNLKEKDFNC